MEDRYIEAWRHDLDLAGQLPTWASNLKRNSSLLCSRKKSKSTNDIPIESSKGVKNYIDLLKTCPLITSPQIMRRGRRKYGVCERNESDRDLVKKCVKYYSRLFLVEHLCGASDNRLSDGSGAFESSPPDIVPERLQQT